MTVALLLAVTGCKDGKDEDTGAAGPVRPDDLDRIATDVWPSKRSEFVVGAHLGTNSILVFGGNQGPIVDQIQTADYLGDTWIFEPGHGWTEVTGDAPRKRGRYAMAVDEVGGRAFLFGGRYRPADEGGNYTLFSDLWAFDFETRTWTELDGDGGRGPDARYYGQAAWDAQTDTLFVWGGMTNEDPLAFQVSDELWAWNEAGGWVEVDAGGNGPSQRSFLGSTHDTRRNRLVIFGGQVGNLSSLAYNDTYALSLDDQTWSRLHNGEREPVFSTRMHTRVVYDDQRDRYILFGGHTDLGDQNDLWAFDPESEDWSELRMADSFTGAPLGCNDNPSEVPADYVEMDLSAPERRQAGMVAYMWDSLWVFGGMHSECSNQLDDTWRYDLGTDTWHELIEATSGESCLRRADSCECLCL